MYPGGLSLGILLSHVQKHAHAHGQQLMKVKPPFLSVAPNVSIVFIDLRPTVLTESTWSMCSMRATLTCSVNNAMKHSPAMLYNYTGQGRL